MQNGSKIINIGFLLPIQKEWMGGVNYFKNLFIAIDYVNKQSSDNILLQPYIIKPDDTELANEFSHYAKFINFKKKKKPNYYTKKILCKMFFKKFNKQKYITETLEPHIDIISHSITNQKLPMLPWIPDFQHIHLPEMFSEKEIEIRNQSFLSHIKQGKFVILSSNDALNDMKIFAPDFYHKARVLQFVSSINQDIYKKTDDISDLIQKKYNLPSKYFYVPNQFWQHKNHKVIFKAISILKERDININVVFTGYSSDYRNKNHYDKLMEYAEKENIKDNIKILGLIDSIEVYYLMRNCISIINPSLFEGWSSTVEEAKSLGKNIILSNLDVHKEQNPPKSLYFNPNNANELAQILLEKWNSNDNGPDYELEELARKLLPERMLSFGKKYKNIILETISGEIKNETA
jgi:glycosyltransferase involved in cell wall biosynthesis